MSQPEPIASGPEAAHVLAVAALEWHARHGRDLAFRRSTDPWAVLVSEVMAQQTQAARAAEAWSTFIERYPTPAALAAASPAEVIRAWRGLGYNRRAIALRAAAVRIVEAHGGLVPDDASALEALPGVGPYTARAVLAIAFGRPVAALDTNIRRVLDRAAGPLSGSPRRCQAAADALVPEGRSAAWTHALMDIGATLCRKREVRCDACPLVALCRYAQDRPDRGPDAGTRITRSGPTSLPQAGAARARPAAPFEATSRWLRGRILDRLRDASDGQWVALAGPIGSHDADAVRRTLVALATEGLLERHPTDATQARLVTS